MASIYYQFSLFFVQELLKRAEDSARWLEIRLWRCDYFLMRAKLHMPVKLVDMSNSEWGSIRLFEEFLSLHPASMDYLDKTRESYDSRCKHISLAHVAEVCHSWVNALGDIDFDLDLRAALLKVAWSYSCQSLFICDLQIRRIYSLE